MTGSLPSGRICRLRKESRNGAGRRLFPDLSEGCSRYIVRYPNTQNKLLTKEHSYRELTPDLLQLRYNLVQLDCQFLEQVIQRDLFRRCHAEQFRQLTDREIEVLQLLAGGLNNPEIAQRLLISRSTVETHRKHLNRKLGLRSFWDLMKYAFAFDLVRY